MNGIFKSSCRVWFETYHVAPDIIRSVLDWMKKKIIHEWTLFYNSRRTEERPPPPTIRVLVCSIRCHRNACSANRWLAVDFRARSLPWECALIPYQAISYVGYVPGELY
jgi:hypothetical protein